jgi:hypothetical protein
VGTSLLLILLRIVALHSLLCSSRLGMCAGVLFLSLIRFLVTLCASLSFSGVYEFPFQCFLFSRSDLSVGRFVDIAHRVCARLCKNNNNSSCCFLFFSSLFLYLKLPPNHSPSPRSPCFSFFMFFSCRGDLRVPSDIHISFP